MKTLLSLLFPFILVQMLVAEMKTIPLDSDLLKYKGTKFVEKTDLGMEFRRFDKPTLAVKKMDLGVDPKKARTTAGVRIEFRTNSSKVELDFAYRPKDENRSSQFAVFKDGVFVKEYSVQKSKKEYTLSFETGGIGDFEVVLPSWSNPLLKGFRIDSSASLEETTIGEKPVYVAIGDSISHGTGQKSSAHLTWPFLLSRKLDVDFYSVAVGGGKISHPVAKMLKHWDQIDVMTILIGYNDWNAGKTGEDYYESYKTLLQLIRENHPETKIYCIRPLYTNSTASKKTKLPIDGLRESLTKLIGELQSAGDSNLFLLKGDEFTSAANLREDNKKDPVHLGIKGASMLADELAKRIPSE